MASQLESSNGQMDLQDARIANFEREENFRWLASRLGTTSPTKLTQADRADEATELAVYALAELAEIAHGSIDPTWILSEDNRRILGRPGFPLEHYPILTAELEGAVEPIHMIQKFEGTRGGLQGYCALRLRPRTPTCTTKAPVDTASKEYRPQIILAFSGTSNARLALYDVMAAPVQYRTSFNSSASSAWKVHDGFQRVYQGVKSVAFDALRLAIQTLDQEHGCQSWDLVLTAHSLGAAVSYLTLLDLIHRNIDTGSPDLFVPVLPASCNITIAVFGSPRVANPFLVAHFRQLIKDWRERCSREEVITEWSVIGHMDGVPSMPPAFFGYTHFCATPFYSFGGHLYRVPESESEHTCFNVEVTKGEPVLYPRGGHNYYGARDMERLQRRLRGIFADIATAPTRKKSRSISVYSNPGRSLRRKKRSSQYSSHSQSQSQGSASQSGSQKQNESRVPSQGSPDPVHNLAATPEESDPAQAQGALFPEPLSSEPDPTWIQRYLAREEEEEEQWKRKLQATGNWSWFRGLMSPISFGRG
ncbi:alpha/beta-hydrolase [Serendipita vermifera]|nr:alpha/beta-hydrolase [Serendipita vermifera]